MSGAVTILYTNDLHGTLTPEAARRLAAWRDECQPAVLLDGGDAVACGNVGFRPGGEPAHRLMNEAGYAAGALGNREFHFRPWPQRCKLRAARFPLLCANLVAPAGYGGIVDQLILEPTPGLRLRLIGLLVTMITESFATRAISPARFEDPVACAQRLTADDDPETLTVLLSHVGLPGDRILAETVPGIDLILGGHSHTGLSQPEVRSGTPIFQNHPYGGSALKLVIATSAGRLTGWRHELIRLDTFELLASGEAAL